MDWSSEAVVALERSGSVITGELQVGVFATAAADLLPVMVARTRHRHPGLVLRSREFDVDGVYAAVASGAVDLAVGLDYPDVPIRRDPALRQIQLYREQFSLAVPAGSMPGVERLSLSETATLGWILPLEHSHYGQAIMTVCRRAGVEPEPHHEVTDTAASLALVEAGMGVSPVTELMLRLRPSRVDVIALEEDFERHIVAIVRVPTQERPSVAALVGVLRDLARLDRDPDQGQQRG
jgi:DNA-binding transcriptional LysR family regulator